MPDVVAPVMPIQAQVNDCRWLPDDERATYARIYAESGFQGGLQWYRAFASAASQAELITLLPLT